MASASAGVNPSSRVPYRAIGRTLYHQDLHERIPTLLARPDAQNGLIDAALQHPAKLDGQASPSGDGG